MVEEYDVIAREVYHINAVWTVVYTDREMLLLIEVPCELLGDVNLFHVGDI
jgi:hypothetical protein